MPVPHPEAAPSWVPPSARPGVGSPPASADVERHSPWHDSSAPTASAASRTARHHRRAGPVGLRSPRRTSSARSAPCQGHRPKAVVGRDPRASGEFLVRGRRRRARLGGCRRLRRRRAAHPGGRLPDGRHAAPTSASCCRRRTTRCPTTASSSSPGAATSSPDDVEDAIEARAGRGVGRGPIGADVGRVVADARRATRATSRTCCRCCRNQLDGLTVVIDGAHGAASQVSPEVFRLAGADGRRDRHRARRPQHQRRLRLDPPRPAQGGRRGPRRRPRHRPRRRRRPLPRGRRQRHRGRRRPDHGASSRVAMKERGALAQDTLVATVMSNLGLLQAMEREGDPRACRPAVGDRYVLEEMRAGRLLPRWRAVRATSSCSTTAPPATACSPASCWRPGSPRPGGRIAELGARDDAAAAGARQRPGRRQAPGRVRRGAADRPSAPRRPRSTAPGACCCASRAPSRWCGSWSRPPSRPRPRRWPTASSRSCGPGCPSSSRAARHTH